ncbi:MAG TPA: hypothetical protein P5531_08020 [Bacteroidales bacterium]|nr:hypothetical protein [Bacteroidales bacterium]HSA43472.1 hypothetical protein [Bacteroidales bacterium]
MKPALPCHIILLFLLGFLVQAKAWAQFFDTGQDPASVKWEHIPSDTFDLIYSHDFSQAGRLAALLHHSLPLISRDFEPGRIKALPVIVHGSAAISNGLVSLAPRRMEIYPVSPQDVYAQDWLEQLALHELRHSVQLDFLRRSRLGMLSRIFGDQVIAAATGLYVPAWFLEGDAVLAETRFSRSGRGRSPAFEMELRAQLLETGPWSYDKAVFGSYRDFVPDKYCLGYHITGVHTARQGMTLWRESLAAVSHLPFIPNPFNRKLKRLSGSGFGGLYTSAMQELDSAWRMEQTLRPAQSPRGTYYHYRFPELNAEGTVIAYRTGPGDIPRLVSIEPTGKEKVVHTPGQVIADRISHGGGLVCWVELIPDPRWENRSYTALCLLDLQTGKLRRSKGKNRWYAPSLSRDGTKVAVVESSESSASSILIVQTVDFQVIKRIPAPGGCTFIKPYLHDAGNRLLAIVLSGKGKALAEIETNTGTISYLTGFEYSELDYPCYIDERICFIAAYDAINKLYCLDSGNKLLRLLVAGRYGVTDPSPAPGGKLIFSEYGSNGYRPVVLNRPEGVAVDRKDRIRQPYLIGRLQQAGLLQPVDFPDQPPEPQAVKYRKWRQLIKFHSWSPLFADIDNTGLYPGFSLFSQNLLNTLFLSAGYRYDPGEGHGRAISKASYRGLYPVLDAGWEEGNRTGYYRVQGNILPFTYRERELTAGLSLPLNLTRGKFLSGIRPSVRSIQTNLKPSGDSPHGLILSGQKSLEYSFSAWRLLRYSARDMGPRLGQSLVFHYRQSFPGETDPSSILALKANIYFPGIYRYHHLRAAAGFQLREDAKTYRFADLVTVPGFSGRSGAKTGTASLTYALPLWCPDYSLPGLLYLKRVSTAVSGHYLRTFDTGGQDNPFIAAVADLLFDLHLFRFFAPLKLGIRAYYSHPERNFSTAFIYTIDLTSY